MSANTIALLYASGEPPVPPDMISSDHADEEGECPQPPQDESIPMTMAEPEVPPPDSAELPHAEVEAPCSNPDLWLYRDRTVALLRKYMRLSIEVGRMPSLLGREFFRARVSCYKASTFEDAVIFVHDIERSLEMLPAFDKQLIAKIVLQEYSKEEAGRILGCGYRTIERLFPEALDHVTEIFLNREILTGLPASKPEAEKPCQGGESGHFSPSD